jgi:hypothetical protein
VFQTPEVRIQAPVRFAPKFKMAAETSAMHLVKTRLLVEGLQTHGKEGNLAHLILWVGSFLILNFWHHIFLRYLVTVLWKFFHWNNIAVKFGSSNEAPCGMVGIPLEKRANSFHWTCNTYFQDLWNHCTCLFVFLKHVAHTFLSYDIIILWTL